MKREREREIDEERKRGRERVFVSVSGSERKRYREKITGHILFRKVQIRLQLLQRKIFQLFSFQIFIYLFKNDK